MRKMLTLLWTTYLPDGDTSNMNTEQLIDLALDFAKEEENIENGLVNWDFVGADIYLYTRSKPDPEMVEVALATAALIVEPNRGMVQI